MARALIDLPTVAKSSRMRIERFPVTILLGVQLLAMVVIPAEIKGTDPLGLILGICGVTVAVAFYIELLSQPLVVPHRSARPVATRAAVTVLIVGIVAVITSALGGRGTYAVQLGLATESPLVSLATPFTVWMLFGTALIMWLYRRGQVTRSAALWVMGLVMVVSAWEGISRAILGSSMAFIFTVAVLAVLSRLIRLRVIVIALLLIPILWPPIYEFRDSLRRDVGGAMVSAGTPLERLQFDTQFAHIGRLVPAPRGLEAPNMIDLIRIGLIPRFLDSPDRPALDTAAQLSVALGGAKTNSESATILGEVFVFEGWVGVVVFAAVLTLLMGYMMRRDNPWAFAFVGVIYWSTMSFSAGYPGAIPKMLQAAVSMLVAFALVRALSRPRSVDEDQIGERVATGASG